MVRDVYVHVVMRYMYIIMNNGKGCICTCSNEVHVHYNE